MSSSIYLNCMLKYQRLPDGTKMTRNHAYRVLATRKHYSQMDDVQHESHYVAGSRKHTLYKAEQALKVDSWMFHHSFLATEGKKYKKGRKGSKKEDWQRNFHQELIDAQKELIGAKEEVSKASGWLWNSSGRDEIVQKVTELTEKIEFLKQKIKTSTVRKFSKKRWVQKQVTAMKKAGGIKISPDGNDFVFADQDNAFGGKPYLIYETDLGIAEKYMLYYLEQKSIGKELDASTDNITASEPILNALHEVTGKLAEFANKEREDKLFELYEAVHTIDLNKGDMANSEARKSNSNSFQPSEARKKTKKQNRRYLKRIRDASEEDLRVVQHINDVTTKQREITKTEFPEQLKKSPGYVAFLASDMMDTVSQSQKFSQKILEYKSVITQKFSDSYENSGPGEFCDKFFNRILGDEEISERPEKSDVFGAKEDPRNLKKVCNWVNIVDYTPTVNELNKETKVKESELKVQQEVKESELKVQQEAEEKYNEEHPDEYSSDSESSGSGYDTDDQTPHSDVGNLETTGHQDKCLYLSHGISTNARDTFLNMGFKEDRIYNLPFKASTENESNYNHEQKRHFCYDSVALSDYIIQKIMKSVEQEGPNAGEAIFKKKSQWDDKCRRVLNSYESTKEWNMKDGPRKVRFTDYEFSDLREWMMLHEETVRSSVKVPNPAYTQANLEKLKEYMTPDFPPSVIVNALDYFKGYHDILVQLGGGLHLTEQMKKDFKAIREGNFVNPFEGSGVDLPQNKLAEEQGWHSWAWGKIKNLGYSLYNGVLTVGRTIFDTMKKYLWAIQAVHMAVCAAGFLYVVSALFASGGLLIGATAALNSPVIRKALSRMVARTIRSSILTSILDSGTTFFAGFADLLHDITSDTQKTKFQWLLSGPVWVMSRIFALDFQGLFDTGCKVVNLLAKWTPAAIMAMVSIWMIFKAVEFTFDVVGGGLIATGKSPFWGGLLRSINIGTAGATFIEWIGPVYVKIHYFFVATKAVGDMWRNAGTFLKGFWHGDMSTVDAIVMFQYVPRMICNFGFGMKGTKFNKHCNKIATLLENSAMTMLIASTVMNIFMDLCYFTGIGNSIGITNGGSCSRMHRDATNTISRVDHAKRLAKHENELESEPNPNWQTGESERAKKNNREITKDRLLERLDETNKKDNNPVHDYLWGLGEAIGLPEAQKLFDESNEHAAFKQWTKN